MAKIDANNNYAAFTPISGGSNAGRLPTTMQGAANTINILSVDRDLEPYTLVGSVTGYYWYSHDSSTTYDIDGALTASTSSFTWAMTSTDSGTAAVLYVVFLNNGLKTAPIRLEVVDDPFIPDGTSPTSISVESSLYALVGVDSPNQNLGSFTGSTIADNGSIKGALQELETSLESVPSHNAVTIGTANGLSISVQSLSLSLATGITSGAMAAADKVKLDGVEALATADMTGSEIVSVIDTHLAQTSWKTQATQQTLSVDHLITLSGVAESADNLGVFAGSTISDNQTLKGMGQDLESAIELINNHASMTIGSGNGLSVSGQELSLSLASLSSAGALSAVDKAKLDTIESNATGDQSGAEISALLDLEIGDSGWQSSPPATTDNLSEGSANLYFTEARVNASSSVSANTEKNTYPTADSVKLASIEANATGDQTAAEIIAEIDTSLGQSTWKTQATKESLDIDHLITLSGVPSSSDDLGSFTGSTLSANATVKVALQELETSLEAVPSHDAVTVGTANGLSLSGQEISLGAATTSASGAMSSTDKTKLDGVESSATTDQTGAEIVSAINTQLGQSDWQTAGGGATWTVAGNDIYYNTGNVGIGESSPSALVHIAGKANEVQLKVVANSVQSHDFVQNLESSGLAVLSGFDSRGVVFSHAGTPAGNFIGGSTSGNTTMTGNNNFISGPGAGIALTTGNNNFISGLNAGNDLTTGRNCVLIGPGAGEKLTTGIINFCLGAYTLASATTAQFNVAIGNAALNKATTNENVAVGVSALQKLTTGGSMVALGRSAGFNTTTGGTGTYLGYQAGYTNITGSGHVMVGYRAGYSETGDNKLYIANSNTANPLIYGEFDNSLVKINGRLRITDNSETAVAGDVRYSPSANKHQGYDGTSWNDMY